MRGLLCVIAFAAIICCQPDFDEVKDSSLRNVTVHLDTKHLFDNVLLCTDDSFHLNRSSVIDDDYCLRVTSYCYEDSDELCFSQTQFANQLDIIQVSFSHLDLNKRYMLFFVADVVKKDLGIGYYETWYQLGTSSLSGLYLFAPQRNDFPKSSVLFTTDTIVTPSNQTLDLFFQPLTFNGFLRFENSLGVDKIKISVLYAQSFYLHNKKTRKEITSHFELYPSSNTSFLPVTLSNVDSFVPLNIKLFQPTGNDSLTLIMPLVDNRPFVANFDCSTMSLTEFTTY